jgi:hypothetical protein
VKRERLLALVVGGALAAGLTFPTIVRPGSMARIDTNDGRFSVWNVAWVAHALVDDPAHLFDANIFYPHQGTLAYSEANLVAGAMAVPVYGLTRNPVAAHNAVVYASFVLAFVAMWSLVRRLTGDPAVAFISATGFAFAPFVSARTAHIQLLMVFVFPVVLLAFHRFVDQPRVRRGAALGAALALAALACGYYGIFAGLAVAWGSAWFAPVHLRSRAYWLGLLTAVVVAAAVVAPVFAPYLELREEAGARRVLNYGEMVEYSADVRAYLTSPAHAHQWLISLVGMGREVLFPGFVVCLGTLAVAVRRRDGPGRTSRVNGRVVGFYVTLGALAAWASFGPDAGLYRWLGDTLPFMSFLRAPARFGIVVVFAMAVLAGFGFSALLPARRRSLAAAGLTLLAAAEVSAAPWPLRQVPPVSAAHEMLAMLPRGPVVEFHFPYRPAGLHEHARYMFRSMWHWQPLVNGYSDYIPPDFRDIMVPINGFPDPVSFRILREREVRYVTIDLETYDGEAREILLARFPPYRQYLRPLVETGDVWLYEVVGYPPDAVAAR